MSNLSEEEKEAMEELKEEINKPLELPEDIFSTYILCDIEKAKTIINLIEKQQKELEEYKKRLIPTPDNPVPIEYQMAMYVDKRDYISKDTIKAKIKELEKEIEEKQEYCPDFTLMYEHEIDTNAIIKTLQELLGEE